jgi:hypothetical protein
MAKVSSKVRAFRRRAKSGAIMSSATFNRIARNAGGGARGQRVAGRAYWNAAKRRAAGFPKGSSKRRR